MDRWLHLICQELNNLIPPRSVRDHGRATDLIERRRDINPTPFLWTFLVDTTQADGSVSAVHDLYKVFTGDGVAYSSIQQWITPDLTDLLTDLVDYVSVELGRTETSLGGRYDRIRDEDIPDATICTLSPESVEDFPGFGDDHAGAKLHMVESLTSVAPVLDSITSARTQETTQFEIGEWIEDSLAMFDLGYLDYGRLGRIEDNDGWFVCRLNVDANPHVIDEREPARHADVRTDVLDSITTQQHFEPEFIAGTIEEFGPNQIMLDTDMLNGLYADDAAFTMKRMILDLLRLGIDPVDVRQVVYENQLDVLGLNYDG